MAPLSRNKPLECGLTKTQSVSAGKGGAWGGKPVNGGPHPMQATVDRLPARTTHASIGRLHTRHTGKQKLKGRQLQAGEPNAEVVG